MCTYIYLVSIHAIFDNILPTFTISSKEESTISQIHLKVIPMDYIYIYIVFLLNTKFGKKIIVVTGLKWKVP